MKEKDIENLIAVYPDEFFPGEGFKLMGQQVRLDGNGFMDILFTDKHDRNIIIEVKKGRLERAAAGQIIDYYGHLKNAYSYKIFELILCANIMPQERKTFLENVGIECKEIPESFIRDVARKHGYKFLHEESTEAIIESPQMSQPENEVSSSSTIYGKARVAAEKYFRNKPFTRKELYDVAVREFGHIKLISFLPADYAANEPSGYEFQQNRNEWIKRHKLFFKLDDGRFEIYDPAVHGEWIRVDHKCLRVKGT